MRVLWLTNMFPSPRFGFRGIFVSNNLDALRRLGEVEIDLELIAQDHGKPDYFLANPRVRQLWRNGRYDLVHVHYGYTGLATLFLPRNTPLLFTFYGDDINLPRQRFVTQRVAARSRRRIFVSRRMSERWPSERNIVLPNGIDFDLCRPEDQAVSRQKLGLDHGRRFVLFGGKTFDPVKNYGLFCEILASVKTNHPDSQELILSTPGQDYAQVIQKMNAADVLLFTSNRGREGSPTVVKEAIAVGLPVVSVDTGDVLEMLEGVTPGEVVEWPRPGETRRAWIERIATAVSSVLESRRRSNGREAHAFLSQDVIARRTLEIYREVLAEENSRRLSRSS